MNQPRRKLLTLILAVPLLVIPAALALNSTLDADQGSMVGMPGMGGAVVPLATPTARRGAIGGPYGEISAGALRAMLSDKDFLLINVHVPYEGELAGTDALIPYDRIGDDTARLPTDRGTPIVLYCRTGAMSAEAATTLVGRGYRDVRHLTRGMEAWKAQGYPLQIVSTR